MRRCLYCRQILIFTFLLFCMASVTSVFAETQPPQVWVVRYDGQSHQNDYYDSLAANEAGDVYLLGSTMSANAQENLVVLKYGADGVLAWEWIYDGPEHGMEMPGSLSLDSEQNVVISGSSAGINNGMDWVVAKLSPSGEQIWLERLSGGGASYDVVGKMRIDRDDVIYVGGTIDGECAVARYSPEGNRQWIGYFTGTIGVLDQVSGMAVNDSGEVFILDDAVGEIYAVKFTSNGNVDWSLLLDDLAGDDFRAGSIELDGGNDLVAVITAQSDGHYWYHLLKIDQQGNRLWSGGFDDQMPSDENAPSPSLVVGEDNSLFLSGTVIGNENLWDYALFKFDSTCDLLWMETYDGPAGKRDEPNGLTQDTLGNLYLVGGATASDGDDPSAVLDFATVKINEEGTFNWAILYDGPSGLWDEANNVVVTESGAIVVAGSSMGEDTGADITVMQYGFGIADDDTTDDDMADDDEADDDDVSPPQQNQLEENDDEKSGCGC